MKKNNLLANQYLMWDIHLLHLILDVHEMIFTKRNFQYTVYLLVERKKKKLYRMIIVVAILALIQQFKAKVTAFTSTYIAFL